MTRVLKLFSHNLDRQISIKSITCVILFWHLNVMTKLSGWTHFVCHSSNRWASINRLFFAGVRLGPNGQANICVSPKVSNVSPNSVIIQIIFGVQRIRLFCVELHTTAIPTSWMGRVEGVREKFRPAPERPEFILVLLENSRFTDCRIRSYPLCLVFEVIWKNLGDSLCHVFEVGSCKESQGLLLFFICSNLKASRGLLVVCFWSGLQKSRRPLLWDFWNR